MRSSAQAGWIKSSMLIFTSPRPSITVPLPYILVCVLRCQRGVRQRPLRQRRFFYRWIPWNYPSHRACGPSFREHLMPFRDQLQLVLKILGQNADLQTKIFLYLFLETPELRLHGLYFFFDTAKLYLHGFYFFFESPDFSLHGLFQLRLSLPFRPFAQFDESLFLPCRTCRSIPALRLQPSSTPEVVPRSPHGRASPGRDQRRRASTKRLIPC